MPYFMIVARAVVKGAVSAKTRYTDKARALARAMAKATVRAMA
jgi:hypothetical protein